MILEQLKKQSTPRGTYAAVKFCKDTTALIQDFCESTQIPNPVPVDDMHCTVIYSRKYLPEFQALGEIDPPNIATFKGFRVFPTSSGEKVALVLELQSKFLHDRHQSIMKEHGATYDFDEYIPHITVSYDVGDFDPSTLDTDKLEDTEFNIVSEYTEDLN